MVFPYVRENIDVCGVTLDVLIADELGQLWYDVGPTYELPEMHVVKTMVNPGDNAVDCGAHHGLFTLLLSYLVGDAGQVISYEALPTNAAVIRDAVELNKRSNVSVRGVGISDKAKSMPIRVGNGNITVVDKGVKRRSRKSARIDIDLVSLDEDLPPDMPVHFLKLDVEGSDVQAVEGAKNTIRTHRPKIDLELHNLLFKNRKHALNSIFSTIRRDEHEFSVLPTVSGEMREVGSDLDLDWLAEFDNPHVFCLPLS